VRAPAARLLLLVLVPLAAAASEPTVVVISLDGVRHDLPDRADAGALPALERMEREGARAARLVPVYPSNTFPGHVSLATGTYPDVHGIVDNRFFDRERGAFSYENDASWIEAEPLWAAAERQGVPAAVFFWVGSETDWRGTGARHRVTPFDSGVGEAAKVERILAWLDLPVDERPRLVMSWWHGADSVGHTKGPDHPDVLGALAAQDRHLADVLAGLDARDAWGHTTLLVVSDHGMTTVDTAVPVRDTLDTAGVDARLVLGTAVAHVFLDDPDALARAEKALAALEGVRVDRGDALPGALRLRHPTRTGDLVLRTDPPRTFRPIGLGRRAVETVMGPAAGWTLGLHGYPPDHPDMAGILYALGRGVPAGAPLGPVHMTRVAPTVAALLGIAPPRQAEAEPVSALLPD